jgi:hypothetical protein
MYDDDDDDDDDDEARQYYCREKEISFYFYLLEINFMKTIKLKKASAQLSYRLYFYFQHGSGSRSCDDLRNRVEKSYLLIIFDLLCDKILIERLTI